MVRAQELRTGGSPEWYVTSPSRTQIFARPWEEKATVEKLNNPFPNLSEQSLRFKRKKKKKVQVSRIPSFVEESQVLPSH